MKRRETGRKEILEEPSRAQRAPGASRAARYGGLGDTTPQGAANRFIAAIATPFEEWPEEVKNGFTYDPDGAEALLDEAGYPRGANGIRFETVMSQLPDRDLTYMQLVASYWGKVGIDVEIIVEERSNWIAKRSERDFEMLNSEMAVNWRAQDMTGRFKSTANYNTSNVNDPAYDALHDDLIAATTIDEQNRIAGELEPVCDSAVLADMACYGPVVSCEPAVVDRL